MTTQIQNISQSPYNRQSEIPFDSIIRQVATPFAYQERPHSALLTVPTQQPLASFHAPLQPQLVPHSSSRMLETAQFVGGSYSQASRPLPQQMQQVVPDLPPLPAVRRVEYVPYEQRYIEYVEQRIKVPVQRVCTDYYQIEHITDYMPIEKEEVVYEIQPQEVVTMRLQYVPVEQ
jgi:hypothetical protein